MTENAIATEIVDAAFRISASTPDSAPIWSSKTKVIVEIKSVESLAPVHKKQLSSNSN